MRLGAAGNVVGLLYCACGDCARSGRAVTMRPSASDSVRRKLLIVHVPRINQYASPERSIMVVEGSAFGGSLVRA